MDLSTVKLMICPLNYSGQAHVSHTGLAVSAQNTARVLRENSVNAVVRPVRNAREIEDRIALEHPTHIVINALWLPEIDLATLVHKYMHISFVVLCHSNIAFLQVEPNGLRLLRQAVDLELGCIGNFNVATNSRSGQRSLQDAWEAPALYLPNLYFLDDTAREHRPRWKGGTLRIGTFGALRPLKNPTGAAFAALSIATNLGTNLEYHINVGRNDGGNMNRLLASVESIFNGLPYAKLVKDPWDLWPNFRRLVRHMHLLLQPSFTESFNVVTADGVAEGVPSVVSDVIEWAPDWWKVSPDDVPSIARTGRTLLSDEHTGRDGLHALNRHNVDGIREWTRYLTHRKV